MAELRTDPLQFTSSSSLPLQQRIESRLVASPDIVVVTLVVPCSLSLFSTTALLIRQSVQIKPTRPGAPVSSHMRTRIYNDKKSEGEKASDEIKPQSGPLKSSVRPRCGKFHSFKASSSKVSQNADFFLLLCASIPRYSI